MARVYEGERDRCSIASLGPVERLLYRAAGVARGRGDDWKTYALAMLLFNVRGHRASSMSSCGSSTLLPLNPQRFRRDDAGSRLQHRRELRHEHELAGVRRRVDDELPHADGRRSPCRTSSPPRPAWPSLVALIRGFARKTAEDDRQLLGRPRPEHALHPPAALDRPRARPRLAGRRAELSPLRARRRCSQATTDAEGKAVTEQVLPIGPAASQIAIKQLGTNGGGFFNVNSAHPFENPTPLSNFLEMLAILLIPARRSATRSARWSETRGRAGRCSPR